MKFSFVFNNIKDDFGYPKMDDFNGTEYDAIKYWRQLEADYPGADIDMFNETEIEERYYGDSAVYDDELEDELNPEPEPEPEPERKKWEFEDIL